MLSRSGPLPTGPKWSFELKWDGFRAVVSTQDGLRVRSRRGWDMTAAEEVERAHAVAVNRAAKNFDTAVKGKASAAKILNRAVREIELAADELARHRPLVDQAAESYRAVLRPDEPFA